jgi:hypothetical protein
MELPNRQKSYQLSWLMELPKQQKAGPLCGLDVRQGERRQEYQGSTEVSPHRGKWKGLNP